MTDPLEQILGRTADELAAAAVVPPVAGVIAAAAATEGVPLRLSAASSSAETPVVRQRRVAIAATAAAVLVVAATAALLGGEVGPAPQGPVPVDRTVAVASAVGDPPRPVRDHAPAPAIPGNRQPPGHSTACAQGEVAAALELDGVNGELRVLGETRQGQPCGLPGTVPVLWATTGEGMDEVPTDYPIQAEVPNPPVRPDGAVGFGRALTADVRWDSYCGAPIERLELRGLAAQPIPVTFEGTPVCQDGADSGFRLERLSAGEPAALVPADREGLSVTATFPQQIPAGAVRRYTATLANPTSRTIALRPCPTYLLHMREAIPPGSGAVGGRSGADSGPLPCDRLPDALGPGEQIVVEFEHRFGNQDPAMRGASPLQLHWGIAGTEAYQTVIQSLHATPPAPTAVVPWKATERPPGEPRMPTVGQAEPYSSLQPTIENLPAQVRPGDLIKYDVRLTNTATAGAVSLDPCPGFVQYLQAGALDLDDEHYMNCKAAPGAIDAGQAILLRMELRIPSDAPTGQAMLTWKVGKLDNSGSPSGFASLQIVRS